MTNTSGKVCKEEKFGSTFVFKEEIAKEYGVESAILLQHFIYSISHHKKNNTHFYEGRYWTYDSITTLTNLYSFWSGRVIDRIIKNLLDKNVLVSGCFNKHKYDRTKWFAFVDEGKFMPVDNPVYESVDNYKKPVDNPVDNFGIKNPSPNLKKSANEPFSPQISSVSRRDGHFTKRGNAFHQTVRPIPIYTSIYNSSGEINTNDNNHGGNFRKGDSAKGNRQNTGTNTFKSLSVAIEPFKVKITHGYIPPTSLKQKLYELGFSDLDIDKGILNMITYHEKNPQIIKNEHSCVLGWFRSSIKMKKL